MVVVSENLIANGESKIVNVRSESVNNRTRNLERWIE
jgi:hypothetical protein